MSAHYRQTLNFTFDGLNAARTALARLDEFQDRLNGLSDCSRQDASNLPDWASDAGRAFREAIEDDLNVPRALGALFEMTHEGNKAMDAGTVTADEAVAILDLMRDCDRVLGVLAHEDERPDQRVDELLEARETARKEKNWSASDSIRDELLTLGWEVRDTAEGQQVKRSR